MTVIRRILVFVGSLMLMAHVAAAQRAGVGAWENPSYTTMTWIESQPGLSWYYDWRTDEIRQNGARRNVEFVPMIHNASNINDRIRSTHPPFALLGFNEPDGMGGDHQAGMSVDEAIALWPQLEARGLRLGSPATTQAGTLGRTSWQHRFMDEVERRGLRVDFMAVHYYSIDGDISAFRNWLYRVYNAYRRPIWVTEFALVDWSRPDRARYEANARFAKEAIRMLESLPFVERYAWFAANPYNWGGTIPAINLVDNNMRPTPVGLAYAEALADAASVSVASCDPALIDPTSVLDLPADLPGLVACDEDASPSTSTPAREGR